MWGGGADGGCGRAACVRACVCDLSVPSESRRHLSTPSPHQEDIRCQHQCPIRKTLIANTNPIRKTLIVNINTPPGSRHLSTSTPHREDVNRQHQRPIRNRAAVHNNVLGGRAGSQDSHCRPSPSSPGVKPRAVRAATLVLTAPAAFPATTIDGHTPPPDHNWPN